MRLPYKNNKRLVAIILAVLCGLTILFSAILFSFIITKTGAGITRGNVSFFDGAGNPLCGEIELTGAGVEGRMEPDANVIGWEEIQNTTVHFNALAAKNVSLNLTISGDSPQSRVIVENHGLHLPGNVTKSPPGKPIKFIEIGASNISYSSVQINIRYSDAELGGVDENSLVILHWNNTGWTAMPTNLDTENKLLTANVTSLSIFAVSAAPAQGAQLLKVVTDRQVILDDPSGWVNGWDTTACGGIRCGPVGNQFFGEETTIRWFVLALDSGGHGAPGINVTTQLLFPNGTLNFGATETTDTNGYANFSRNLDNLNQRPLNATSTEGFWKINTSGVIEGQAVNASAAFIYDEIGCGKSGIGCHVSQDWQPVRDNNNKHNPQNIAAEFPPGNSGNSPYVQNRDTIHGTSGHGGLNPVPQILSGECMTCHKSYNGTYINASARQFNSPQFPGGLHANRVACTGCHGIFNINNPVTNMPVRKCYDCHPILNNNVAGINYIQNATLGYSFFPLNTTNTIHIHNLNNTVPCIFCHENGHNISRPFNAAGASNGITEFQQCTSCHIPFKRHNDSLSCTVCHSQDAHVIKVFSRNATYINGSTSPDRGNCTGCHQNVTFFDIILAQPKAGNHSGRNPPQVQTPMNHSNDSLAGRKWNQTPGYWTPLDQLSSCKYCHGETLHKTIALGRPSLWKGSNIVNSTIADTSWCAGCHWQGYTNGTNTYDNMVNTFTEDNLSVPPEISGNVSFGANQSNPTYFNHSGVDKNDSSCLTCHGSLAGGGSITGSNITGFMHNVATGSFGGPDCISCHDFGRRGSGHRINNSDMISLPAIHAGLNRNATNSTGVPADNRKCWGCHDSGGREPPQGSMGDRFSDPFKCYDCHNATGKPYANVSSAPNVSEHFKGGGGINGGIKAASNASDNSSSCIVCHNLGEMKVPFSEDDIFNSAFSLASHYGKKRPDLRTGVSTNCSYCHQNGSTVFDIAMVDTGNKSIANHSLRFNSSNPGCTAPECHNSGLLHNSTLTKPILLLPDSSFCLACHGNNGTGSTNFTDAVTGVKEKHNNTVDCTACHLNNSKDIHPVKYLQSDGSFNTTNSTGANCIICHQISLAAFPTAPPVPVPLHHSDNPFNGTLWNLTAGYWNSEDTITACIYCHNDTKHSSTALGRPANWKGNNTINSGISLVSPGNWCAGCHWQGYTSGLDNYDDMVNTFRRANLPVPPEITGNVSFGANSSNPSYLNHSSFAKIDSSCKDCHGRNLAPDAGVTQFMHNVSTGVSGGADCISCHDIGGNAPAHIDLATMDSSGSLHKNLNSNAMTILDPNNKRCWACHGNGTQPGNSHPPNYKTPFRCPDCHVQSPFQNLNFTPAGTLLNVSQHYLNGTNIKTGGAADADAAASCYGCHNKSEMLIPANDPDSGTGAVFGGANGGNISPSHYGKKRPDLRDGVNSRCAYCHQNTSTVFASAMVDINNSLISNHSLRFNSSNPDCTTPQCHNSGWIHNSTLIKPALPFPNSSSCLACHGNNGSGGTNFTGAVTGVKEKHNNAVDCTGCHLNNSRDIHPVKYLQPDGSYSIVNTTGANCIACHQKGLAGFPDAPRIPEPMHHSENPLNGTIWNQTPGYWNPSDSITACIYCHNDTKHSSIALGRPANWKGNNIINSGIASISPGNWCAGCHWQGYASGLDNYNDMVKTFIIVGLPIPPEITGNVSFGANQGNPSYFNHSDLAKTDSSCRGCHGGNLSAGAALTEFMHKVATGSSGGPDCAACHDTGGSAPRLVDFSVFRESVHRDLNSVAVSNTSLSETVDKACWACHGEGTEPAKHPQRYKNARKCGSNDCHSLSQSFKAPMVYSHFKDADLNGNPSNATSYNITTSASCETCHLNSRNAAGGTFNGSVSHYASRKDLVDSINCIFCHLDEDNAKKWGNATEINKNSTSLIELNREKNKFTARAGEFVDLGHGFRIKVNEVSISRGSAAVELYKADSLVDRRLVNIGRYVYEENRIIKNATSRIPVLVLNITDMFVSGAGSFIQFEGFRLKRLHYENRTTSCYLCHFTGGAEKHKYTVIDRQNKYVFYTEVLFNSSDRNEYDQEQALRLLANTTPGDEFINIEQAGKKTLHAGEKWEFSGNYSLMLEDVSENSDSARFLLEAGGRSYTYIVKRGEVLDHELSTNYPGYQYKNITILRANISEISQGKPGIAVLENILVLSPEIGKINDNTTIFGYNTSWLLENSVFLTGRIPADMHAPLLHDGRDGGADCNTCHSIELGAHTIINRDARSSVDPANKACWACHGNGNEPQWHPATYKIPMVCKSCHVGQKVPYFNASYIGDEKHGALQECNSCHVTGTHRIMRFDVTPGIRALSLSKGEVYAGEKVVINATASAGYEMRLRGAEYYIDSQANTIPMYPVDGSFDDQVEDLTAQMDTSGLQPGNHLIYVRAMERNNKWGSESSVSLVIAEKEFPPVRKGREKIPATSGFSLLTTLIIVSFYLKKKLLRRI